MYINVELNNKDKSIYCLGREELIYVSNFDDKEGLSTLYFCFENETTAALYRGKNEHVDEIYHFIVKAISDGCRLISIVGRCDVDKPTDPRVKNVVDTPTIFVPEEKENYAI